MHIDSNLLLKALHVILKTLWANSDKQNNPPIRSDPDTRYGSAKFLSTLELDSVVKSLDILTECNDDDLRALEVLNRWYYRNLDGPMRMATLVLSEVLPMLYSADAAFIVNAPHGNLTDSSSIVKSLVNEDETYLVSLLTKTLVGNNMEAKLPFKMHSRHYEMFREISRPELSMTTDGDLVEESVAFFRTTTLGQNVTAATSRQDREYAGRRLTLVVKTIAAYKTATSYSPLRGFLNNMSTYLAAARMAEGTQKNDWTLASDLQDILHTTERALNNNSVTANNLLARMESGQLVYKEMMELSQLHHRLIATDLNGVFVLYARVISYHRDYYDHNDDTGEQEYYSTLLTNILETALASSGIKAAYLNQIYTPTPASE